MNGNEMRLKGAATTLSLAAALTGASSAPGHAQGTLVWAGANDNPNTLITARFNGGAMTWGPEIPSGGATTGSAANVAPNQVRVHRGAAGGGCSLIAQTNDATGNISIYSVDSAGVTTPVAGSPFAAGTGLQSLAWAPDGGALYAPLGVAGASQVITFRVSCTPGGAVTVTSAGPTTLAGFNFLRDADVYGPGTGSHLCVSASGSNTVGCVPIDPVTRLPGTTAVNTITVNDARGMRIASNGCGVAAAGNANLVRGFAVLGGTIFGMNTAGHLGNPRYGATSPDGSFAAFGSSGPSVALYVILPATCGIQLLDANMLVNPAARVEHVAFDEDNHLYVADGLLNQVRVYQASFQGLGLPLSTSSTNHGTVNPPGGIDASLAGAVPVSLQTVAVD
jgi:hypothetical protein